MEETRDVIRKEGDSNIKKDKLGACQHIFLKRNRHSNNAFVMHLRLFILAKQNLI